jgi:hypothetical protein
MKTTDKERFEKSGIYDKEDYIKLKLEVEKKSVEFVKMLRKIDTRDVF